MAWDSPVRYSSPTKKSGEKIDWADVRKRTGGSSGAARNRRLAAEAAARKAELQAAARKKAEKAAAERKQAELEIKAGKLNQARISELVQEKRKAEELRRQIKISRSLGDKSLEAAKAVELRENLTRQAQLRGRAFTKSEARKFLGGGAGVQALRAGTAAERSYFKKTGVSLSQEREKLRRQAELMKGVTVYKIIAEVLPSRTSADNVRIRLPNGKIEEVSKTGRVNISSSIGGQKVVVHNGKIIQVGEDNVKRVMLGNFDAYTRQKQGGASEFTRVAPATSAVNNYRDKLRMKKIRGDINSGEEFALLVGGFAAGVLGTLSGVLDLPQATWNMIKNPSQIRQAYGSFKRGAETFGEVLWLSPGEGLAYIAGSYYGLKGTDAAIRSVSRVSSSVLTRLNRKFVGVAKVGKTLNVKIGGGRSVNLKVVGKIPKQTISKQISLAGKRVNAVSTQADDLFKLLKRQKVVRKPIPGEANFNAATKRLLKKFDSKTITKIELYQLDSMIRAQGAKGILERSFFLDPTGKIRPSRMGISKEKGFTFSDYMSSDITFKKAKPAIYVFDDLKIAKYPKNIRPIVQKMKQGKSLSPKEFTEYAKWHASPSGNAKPLGFATKESEILLSPGEILKKRGVAGYTLVNGRRVKIVRVGVYKPTGNTLTLIKKLRQGKITPSERIRLTKILKKQTGLNYGSPSSAASRARYVSIKKVGYNTLSRFIKTGRKSVKASPRKKISKTSRKLSSSKRTSKGTSIKRRTSKTSRTTTYSTPRSKASSPRSPKRTSKGSSRASTRKVAKKKPIIKPSLPKGFTKKKLSTPTPAYYVIVKRRGKLVKLMAKPLTKKDARDYLAYSIDNGLERSAWFVPVGKAKVTAKLPPKMNGYYGKVSKKLRPYRIRAGKKKQLLDGYIEKRGAAMDTAREKAQAQRLRAKKRVSKTSSTKKRVVRKAPVRRKTTINRNTGTKSKTTRLVRKAGNNIRKQRAKRVLTPTQRKVLIQRLAKARRVKAQNAKRRK